MSKQNKSSLIDFARPSMAQIVSVISFIGLVCVSFGLIIAFAADNISTSLIWVLSIFLIIFSVFGLIFSVFLILRQAKNLSIEKINKELEWKISPPEKQKTKLKREALEIAELMSIPEEQMSELLSAYIVAEDLALRSVQIDMEKPLMRNVNVGNIPFDGVLIDKNTITCIEMTFLVSPEIEQDKITKVLNKLTLAEKTSKKTHPETKIKLLYLAVTQLDEEGEAKIRSTIVEKFSTTPTDVDIRMFDFAKLQKTFALE